MTKLIDGKARCPSDRCDMAEIRGDDVCRPELATHQSVMRPYYEMCDASAPTHEMYEPSFPTEMPTWASARPRDSPDLLHPNNSETGRRSLWHRRRGMSSIANSSLDRQSDGNKYEIVVSTDISRKISDSSGTPTGSSRVETTISSSPKHKSLDLDRPLPMPPQRNSLKLTRTSLPNPGSNSTHLPPRKNTSSNRLSGMDHAHRFSSRASVSYLNSEVVECAPTETSPDIFWTPHDTSWVSHSRREPSFMGSSSSDIEMRDEILAGNASSENPNCPEEPRNPCSPWNVVSPSTLAPTADSPDQNIVSPSSGFSFPLSDTSSPISPIFEALSSPSKPVFPFTICGESLDLGAAKQHEDGAGGCDFSSPPSLELKTKEHEHPRSAFNTSEPRLSIKRPVSNRTVSSASGAHWSKHSMPSGHFHPSHRRFRSEGWQTPSVSTQSRQFITPSSNSASLMHSRGIDELLESEVSSSIINPIMTKFDASSPWSPVLWPSLSFSAPPAPDVHMNSSCVDGNTRSLQAKSPVPTFAPVDLNTGDHDLYELTSPISRNDQPSLFSSRCSSERWPDIASWDERQMHVLPLFCLRRDISSPNDRSEEADSRPRRLRVSPTGPTLSQTLSPSLTREGQTSGVAPESDVISAHQCRLSLSNAIHSPSPIKTIPHCFDHASLLVTHSLSKETQVEQLEALVAIVNDYWMQRLKSIPELWLRCSILSVRVVFEKGIWTLRECFRGKFAQTFEDAFALVHLAFASAFLLHCQPDFDNLDAFNDDAFYDDALQWQQTITDKEDKSLFLKAMDRWLSIPEPELQPNPLGNSSRYTSFNSIISTASRESFSYSNRTDLMEVLSNSEFLKPCTIFLDGE